MPTLIWHYADVFLSLLRQAQRCYDQNNDGLVYSLVVYDYLYIDEIKTFGEDVPIN